jgi:cbb3-type cytochrome oxidase subunit 3
MFILSLVFFGFILLFFAAAAAVGLILLPVFLVFILPWFFRKKNKEEVRDNEDRIVEIIETKAEVVEDDDIKLIEEADKRGE